MADTCRYDGCERKIRANGFCIKHNEQWRAGEPMTPLPPVPRPSVCPFEGCDRPARYMGWCKQHRVQQRSGRPMHAIGDMEATRTAKRAAWERMTPDEQQRRIATSLARTWGKPYVRSDEWRRRMSASRVGRSPNISGIRNCFGCGSEFAPRSGPQTWCSIKCRESHRRALSHGLTLAELRAMEDRQGQACAICQRKVPLHIDHDHVTETVRGLLCSTCNTGLGKLGDSAENLRRALAYLER